MAPGWAIVLVSRELRWFEFNAILGLNGVISMYGPKLKCVMSVLLTFGSMMGGIDYQSSGFLLGEHRRKLGMKVPCLIKGWIELC